MNLYDFLQWLGVGGVAIGTMIIGAVGMKNNRIKDQKSNEQMLIDQLQEELKSRDTRMDSITARLDILERDNTSLRTVNYNLQIERDKAILEKEKIERNLVERIDKLERENEDLKAKINELEEKNKQLEDRYSK